MLTKCSPGSEERSGSRGQEGRAAHAGAKKKRMFGKGAHNERDHKSAAEYRQTADEHVQTLKDFWKEFLVSGLFVLAALVIILACLAWFAANNKVNATGSSISAKGSRYTITAAGDGAAGSHVGYYERDERTADEKEKLEGLDLSDSMTVTSDSNLNNNTAGSIYPGARGCITLTVTPVATDLNGVTISLSRILKTTAQGTVADLADGTSQTLTADQQNLIALAKGHVLFFESCDNGYYSHRITDSSISIPKERFCAAGSTQTTEPVTVNIYWVWPEYLQNFVLLKNANYYKNLFAEQYGDYTSLQSYVNDHKTSFYYGISGGTSGGTAVASAPNLSPAMSSADIATCSALYNNADEYLGNNIAYFQLRITSREGAQ